MKKTLLKIALSVLVATGLSSCLGDTTSSITSYGYAYITGDFIERPVAVLPTSDGQGLRMRSEVLEAKGLEAGDCVLISKYKIYTDKMNADGSFNGEDIVIADEAIIKYKYHRSLRTEPAPVVEEGDVESAFSNLRLSGMTYVPLDTWGDRWIIPFGVALTDGQNAELDFYYDKNKQTNASGEPLKDEDNIVVVDVRLTKTAPGAGKVVVRELVTAAKFADLRRQIIDGVEPGKEAVIKNIYFRYYQLDKTGEVTKTKMKHELAGRIIRLGKDPQGGGSI